MVSIGDYGNASSCLEGLRLKGDWSTWAGYHGHRLPDLERFSGKFLGADVIRDETGKDIRIPFGNTEVPEHDQSFFTVVTETEMTSKPIRITEKALKPLVNFHPFLILGNPGSLGFVRDLGFQTFAGFMDESYDQEPNPIARFKLLYRQFSKLCRADEADLKHREAKMRERLTHNAEWGLTKLPAIMKQRDRAFLDEVFGYPS